MVDAKEYTATCADTGLFTEVVFYLIDKGAKTGIVQGYGANDADLRDAEFRGIRMDIWSEPLKGKMTNMGQRVTLRATGTDISDKLADVLHEFDFRELPDPNR